MEKKDPWIHQHSAQGPLGCSLCKQARRTKLEQSRSMNPGVWVHPDGSSEHSAQGPFGCLLCANERRKALP